MIHGLALFPPDPSQRRFVSSSAGDFSRGYDPRGVFAPLPAGFDYPDTLSYYNKMTHFDLVTGLPALLHVEDRVSMAASLESRVPLLDLPAG